MQAKRFIAGLALFLGCWSVTAGATDLLGQAKQLLDQGHAEQAYQLLHNDYDQRAGSPDYDLLLGIAALDSGRPTRAVFAFERVLAVEPDNARARAELARAYYEAGENEAAKQEFTSLKQQSVPESVSTTIDKYLSQIEMQLESTRTRVDVYVEGSAGYDSNANSATDSSTIAVPAFGNLVFTLDQTGRSQDSGFFGLGAGTRFSTPFQGHEDLRINGDLNINEKITYGAEAFRTRIANGKVGLRYTSGRHAFVATLQGQKYYLGGNAYRDQGGGGLQWQYSYNRYTRLSVFGQFAAQRFPDQAVRDVDQVSGGIGLVHLFRRPGEPVVFASAFAGTDLEQEDNRDYIGREFYGVRAGGQYSLTDDLTLVGNLSYQYSRYGGQDPLFRERRQDHFLFLRAGVEYEIDDHWLVRPELQYSRNDSSLPINEFERWQPFITIRNRF